MALEGWIPESCTLPTVEQPLRRSEFDALFAKDFLAVLQPSPRAVRFELRADPDVAARAASLAAQETRCCSFFTFDLTITNGEMALNVATEPGHEPVLAALTARARAKVGGAVA